MRIEPEEIFPLVNGGRWVYRWTDQEWEGSHSRGCTPADNREIIYVKG
jgi:hypothetical protein